MIDVAELRARFPGVIGIDPSYTGFAIYDGLRVKQMKTGPEKGMLEEFDMVRRTHEILKEMERFVNGVAAEHQLWYVEAPIFGSTVMGGHLYQMGYMMGEIAHRAALAQHEGYKTTLLTVTRQMILKTLFGKVYRKKEEHLIISRARAEYGAPEFEHDAGLNKLDAFLMWRYGVGCLAGEWTHYPLARRGKPKSRAIQPDDAGPRT